MSKSYTTYNPDQIAKIGHTIAFLTEKLGKLSKTRLLKLLYILDELSIKKSGIPFLNLTYKVWKFGPVAEDLFVDFSSQPTLLKQYIERKPDENGKVQITAKVQFSDDEFTMNDLDLMEYVVEKFGGMTKEELIDYTHRKHSPWHETAKENDVLELLEKEEINNTEFVIDLGKLVDHDERKLGMYKEYMSYSECLI